MNNQRPADIVKRFKEYRLDQRDRVDRMMSLTSRLEDVFHRVSAAIGNDPVKLEPIARVNRQMADYQHLWGISLNPIYGSSVTLSIDAAGNMTLHDGNTERVIEDVISGSRDLDLLVKSDPDNIQHVVLQDFLFEHVAKQLERAMRDGIVIR